MDWIISSGLRILFIFVVAYIAFRILKAVLRPAVTKYVKARGKGRHSKSWFDKRANTLNGILTTAAAVVIIIIVAAMVLSELGVDIGPLIAGAGVAGVAIGFGAQSIIKDFLSGMFIMLEDQYNVGDVIKVGSTGGLVEEVNLRRTVLRDLDGIVHSIPNGEITTVSNFTRDLARVKLDVPVGYGEDLDHVISVINEVGNKLGEDKYFKALITKAPQVLRVENFGDSGIDIRILGETQPMHQWEVTGELRKRLKRTFDEEGIEIPWPHTKLYFSDEQLERFFKKK
jgi:small conductance mechanosensitive channel